jgi:multidrug transporter EmrE-like cation transporter
MPRNSRVSLSLVTGLTLAIVFDTIQQLAWKMGMDALPEAASPGAVVEAVLREPLLGLVTILMVVRLINWLWVLKLADLSYAQPITSLSYVTVTVASTLYLHETLTPLQIIGMAIIMAGVWCIGRTTEKSAPSEVSSS